MRTFVAGSVRRGSNAIRGIFEMSLGHRPHWGRWQNGMGMTSDALEAFTETVAVLGDRLQRFGKSPSQFNSFTAICALPIC